VAGRTFLWIGRSVTSGRGEAAAASRSTRWSTAASASSSNHVPSAIYQRRYGSRERVFGQRGKPTRGSVCVTARTRGMRVGSDTSRAGARRDASGHGFRIPRPRRGAVEVRPSLTSARAVDTGRTSSVQVRRGPADGPSLGGSADGSVISLPKSRRRLPRHAGVTYRERPAFRAVGLSCLTIQRPFERVRARCLTGQ
jgi:hypothetical protein